MPEQAGRDESGEQSVSASESTKGQAGREMSAAEMRSLSAIGSRRAPRVVFLLNRRAQKPSRKSVTAATRKTPSAQYSRAGILVSRTTTRRGTRKMRKSVSPFGTLRYTGVRF